MVADKPNTITRHVALLAKPMPGTGAFHLSRAACIGEFLVLSLLGFPIL